MDAQVAHNRFVFETYKKNRAADCEKRIQELAIAAVGYHSNPDIHIYQALQALTYVVRPELPNIYAITDDAVAVLNKYATLLIQIQGEMAQRDLDIANFVLPYPEAGL
jgi:hypothetical protein